MNQTLKEWTFLLYANGNNELEPETWQSVEEIQAMNICANIHVIVQVSREKQDNIAILRPDKSLSSFTEIWNGVRRYVFDGKSSTSFHNLTDINMANPAALYDFIGWAITNFPAKRYMLSISGHIYQFVGMCPDYSGDKPLMMGFPELSVSIQSAFELHNTDLEVLILDTCYASTIEILYELGRYNNQRVKQVLTYIGKGPLSGLPYSDLLSILEQMATKSEADILHCLVTQIKVSRMLYGLIALKINHEILELTQQLFHKMASSYLLCKDEAGVTLTPEFILSNYRADYPWSHYLKPIHKLLKGMIISAQYADNCDYSILPIHILYQKIPDSQRKELYGRLAFAKQNSWTALLCDSLFDLPPTTSPVNITAIPITKNVLTAFIYAGNEDLPMDEIKKIMENLVQTKNWQFE